MPRSACQKFVKTPVFSFLALLNRFRAYSLSIVYLINWVKLRVFIAESCRAWVKPLIFSIF